MFKKRKKSRKLDEQARLKRVVLPVMIVIGAGAAVLVVIGIILIPQVSPGAQRGVGADGFQAYQEKNTSLGIADVVSRDEVVKQLGSKAKSVGNTDISSVFNYDGSRGQTATYPFVRTDGVEASLYVDMTLFKNQATLDSANVTQATIDAGKINGYQAYYMHALTIGSDRQYRLLILNGVKAYKLAISQPLSNIKINEISSLAILKRLAQTATF